MPNFKKEIIDGITVIMFPLKPLLAMRLDKRITSLALHSLSGKDEINFANILDEGVSKIIGNFAEALDSLDDDEYMKIVLNLFSSSQVGTVQIDDEDSFNEAFKNVPPLTINKIMLKVMEYNKFTPFGIAAGMGLTGFMQDLSGNQMTGTSILAQSEKP